MAHHGQRLVIRSLRATYILAFLFAFSLFYFVIESGLLAWIVQNALSISGQDIEEQMLDKYKLTAHRRIQWLADSTVQNTNAVNDSFVIDEGKACRNTVQGRTSVTDDRGYTCERAFLMSNGCCEVSTQSIRFSCAWCDLYTGCCSHYEQCVSCCLRPEQKNILLEVIESTSGHRLRQILSATDQFELCMLKCRTSSNSVHSENKYKSEKTKYCYKQEPNRPFSR
uniref:SREBP regulating gene protein n=1 Tax=Elaeophora elaphi TaxID=1147741 RepID=A0A0R3RW31_9BILA